MNEIYLSKITFKNPVTIKEIDRDGIKFSDQSELIDYHERDCCENVYADWLTLNDTDIKAREIKSIEINGVPGFGVRLKVENIDGFGLWYSLPCYNEQNGYYCDNLSLRHGVVEIMITPHKKNIIG